MMRFHRTNKGFTFVEVIAVLVIIVIISAVVISKSDTVSNDLITQTEILKSHLRYAQTMGMSGSDSSDVFGINCDTDANFYWMFKGNPGNVVMLPDDQRYNRNHDGKLDLSQKKITIDSDFVVYFDRRGVPYDAYTDKNSNNPLSENLTVTVTPRGRTAPVASIIITPLTGFVP